MAKKKVKRKARKKATDTECAGLRVAIKDAQIAAKHASKLSHKRGGATLKVTARALRKNISRMSRAKVKMGCGRR